jgi:hypothetical protein
MVMAPPTPVSLSFYYNPTETKYQSRARVIVSVSRPMPRFWPSKVDSVYHTKTRRIACIWPRWKS